MHSNLYESAEVLQGYRNLGKYPIERIDEFVKEQSHKEEDAEEVVEKSPTNARNDA